jgi:hypothetical protein
MDRFIQKELTGQHFSTAFADAVPGERGEAVQGAAAPKIPQVIQARSLIAAET